MNTAAALNFIDILLPSNMLFLYPQDVELLTGHLNVYTLNAHLYLKVLRVWFLTKSLDRIAVTVSVHTQCPSSPRYQSICYGGHILAIYMLYQA